MKQLQFKIKINCGGCVSKINPVLKDNGWSVDNKALTVKTDSLCQSNHCYRRGGRF